MQPQIGTVIGKRFRLLEPIHVGSLGSLWRAADRVPGKEAVVRFADPSVPAETIEVFARELTTAKAVQHPALARIYDAGDAPLAWAASELVAGEPLESILADGPLTAIDALALVAELAGALAELHEHGIAHGTVGVRAVLVQGLRPKLIGLGRGRLLGTKPMGARAHRLPEAAYFAPEVIASQGYDTASDVWSLGALLYRCVCGAPPFSGRTSASLSAELRHIDRTLATIDDARTREIVAACLAVEPGARPRAADVAARCRTAARELWREKIVAMRVEDAYEDEPEVAPEPASATVPTTSDISFPPMIAATMPPPVAPSEPPVEATYPPAPPEPDEVDFRPRRSRVKLVGGLMAAAALVIGLIVTTREPARKPPVAAARVASAEAPSASSSAVAEAPPSVSAPPAASPPPSASLAPAQTVSAKTPTPTAAAAPPRPAQPKVSDDNPYE